MNMSRPLISRSRFQATKQVLGAASQYSEGFGVSEFPADGLMGMAFQSISEYNAKPVFQTFVGQRQTSQPVFAFKLASSGAELDVGGLNTRLYSGPVTYIPVTQEVRTDGWSSILLHGLTGRQ